MTNPFGDAGDAQFMPRNPFDDDSASLRRQLAAQPEFLDVSRMSDAQVRTHLANLRSTGRLTLRHPHARLLESRVMAISASQIDIPAEPVVRKPLISRSVPPAPTEPNPFDVIDHDVQAAVLNQAAANGTPFCEECAKLAKADR